MGFATQGASSRRVLRWLLVAGVLLGVMLLHGVQCGAGPLGVTGTAHHMSEGGDVAPMAAASLDEVLAGPVPPGEHDHGGASVVAGACLFLLSAVAGVMLAGLAIRRLPGTVSGGPPRAVPVVVGMVGPGLFRLCVLRL